MRLYLSSLDTGHHADRLVELVGRARRVAVIANAMDVAAPRVRRRVVAREIGAMSSLGFDPHEVDLREFFGAPTRLRRELRPCDAVWIPGGNVFVLRRALQISGADRVLRDLLERDEIVYSGYSAGPCVLAPSLRGFERVDDPDDATRAYGVLPSWEGMGVVDFAFVPHYDSPGNPETERINDVIASLEESALPYRALRDGEVLVMTEDGTEFLG